MGHGIISIIITVPVGNLHELCVYSWNEELANDEWMQNIFQSAPFFSAASGEQSLGDSSVCLDVYRKTFFKNYYSSSSLADSNEPWHTIYVPISNKNVEEIFGNFILNCWRICFKF